MDYQVAMTTRAGGDPRGERVDRRGLLRTHHVSKQREVIMSNDLIKDLLRTLHQLSP